MVLMSSIGYAQRSPVTQNYRKFDRKLVHFGFMLGVNTSDFSVQYKPNMPNDYNVYSISNKSQPGFQLGIISSLKLGTPLLRLRFIPSLSFQERVLNYTFLSEDQNKDFDTYEERVGSTNLDFPLLLKFRTARYNNFAAYIIGGAQYTLDYSLKRSLHKSMATLLLKFIETISKPKLGQEQISFYLSLNSELK